MSRARHRVVAALLGAAAVMAPALGTPPAGAVAPPTTAPAAAPSDDPLDVTITGVSPAVVPESGPIEITGTVSNDSIETWEDVQLYGVPSPSPITDAAALAEAADSPDDLVVGERITEPGTFPDVGTLTPGASRSFTITLPRRVLADAGVSAEGVYWLGVQALGASEAGRDGTADGRARTFLPLVEESGRDAEVDTALVLPLRHEVNLDADGRVTDLDAWATDLSPGGRLDRILDFGAEADDAPLTWLLDTAVPDTVAEVIAGNRGRTIAPTPGVDGDGDGEADGGDGNGQDGQDGEGQGGEEEDPSPDGEGSTPGGGSTPDDEPDPTQAAVDQFGGEWLEQLRSVLGAGSVLTLPYGDVDADAALRGRSRMLQRARVRARAVASEYGLRGAQRAITSPTGYLDAPTIAKAPRSDTILLSDAALGDLGGDGDGTSRARVDGRPVVVTDSGAAEGGPGPDDPLSPLALRQRLLSEAALRLVASSEPSGGGDQLVEGDGDPQSVVTLPDDWSPAAGTDFFAEIEAVDWMRLTDLSDATESSTAQPPLAVTADQLDYPEELAATELPPSAFAEARGLVDSATVLQDVLPLNETVARHALDEALLSLSYDNRDDPQAAEDVTAAAATEVRDLLGEVDVETPPSVTLSGDTGDFSLQITNGLPEPVEVRLRAVTDGDLEITGPDAVEVPAEAGTSVRLTAATTRLGVTDVDVEVVDSRGRALGASDQLPLRSVQIGNVIWLIMGAGAALLLGAIVLRLVRRVRASRGTRTA
ncbi:DUF6049 family protein [Nocardioides sp. CFH 31398]|uniref:DUF6049 family protein n=1 Tax=Nocardioides sp. CFH 31398 TaxID=2919579 RepID=UPI001F0691AB|nr:DUF6049 family protein [Nocardioides sp. CFH 31398]MCH1865712.1 DUF6049 family protein [Nocardioides sp. CFH 31398]